MENPAMAEALSTDLGDGTLQRALDQVSLEQALRDFEIANARVIDLTRRLVASEHQVVSLQQQVDAATQALTALQAAHEGMQRSTAYRIATRMVQLRKMLRA